MPWLLQALPSSFPEPKSSLAPAGGQKRPHHLHRLLLTTPPQTSQRTSRRRRTECRWRRDRSSHCRCPDPWRPSRRSDARVRAQRRRGELLRGGDDQPRRLRPQPRGHGAAHDRAGRPRADGAPRRLRRFAPAALLVALPRGLWSGMCTGRFPARAARPSLTPAPAGRARSRTS